MYRRLVSNGEKDSTKEGGPEVPGEPLTWVVCSRRPSRPYCNPQADACINVKAKFINQEHSIQVIPYLSLPA